VASLLARRSLVAARSIFERVILDSSVLLGDKSARLIAAADLNFFRGYWSSWIAVEFARVRTEWIARRLVKETPDMAEANRRLDASRSRVNAAISEFSRVLTLVDYNAAPEEDLSWLADGDDRPIMQTALAVGTPCSLVTDNTRDFPPGEERNGVLFLSSEAFLKFLFEMYPEANDAIANYLSNRRALG